MKGALDKYDGNPYSFNVIERLSLTDDDLQFFSYGQEKRDFTGKILKKLLKKGNSELEPKICSNSIKG
jgi:hypothetical protein